MKPCIGAIVVYKLTDTDARLISTWLTSLTSIRGSQGALAAYAGEQFPAVIIGTDEFPVNGDCQLHLMLGAASWRIDYAAEGDGNGQWTWPERQAWSGGPELDLSRLAQEMYPT